MIGRVLRFLAGALNRERSEILHPAHPVAALTSVADRIVRRHGGVPTSEVRLTQGEFELIYRTESQGPFGREFVDPDDLRQFQWKRLTRALEARRTPFISYNNMRDHGEMTWEVRLDDDTVVYRFSPSVPEWVKEKIRLEH